MQRMIRHRDC